MSFTNPSSRAYFDRFLYLSEERKLWAHMKRFSDYKTLRDYSWMMLTRQTGARIKSIVSLNVGDAEKALRTGYLEFTGLKGGRDLRQIITTVDKDGRMSAATALRNLLKIRKKYMQSNEEKDPLIISKRKKRISIRSCEENLSNYCREAGIERPITPHFLRHTLARRILDSCNNMSTDQKLKVIADRLGHSDIRSTMFYTLPSLKEYTQLIEETA